jgi:MoxR-like ATPase
VPVPLVCVVGASNEGPADEALQAFHDRFLVRVPVAPVADESFADLLRLDAGCVSVTQPLTAAERDAVARAAAGVALGDDLLAACAALRKRLAADGQPLSDRRWRQWMDLLRTAAATEGRATADALHLWTAPYVAAASPAQVPALQAWVDAEIAQAVPQDAPWLTRAVEAFEMQLQVEQMAPADGADDTAGKLALARSIGGADGDGGMLRLVSATLEDRLRRRWSPVHVQARLDQIDQIAAQASAARTEVAAQAQALATRIAGRLWLPPGLAARWQAAHAHTLAVLDALLARLAATRAGFAAQPQDDALPALTPAAVDVGP